MELMNEKGNPEKGNPSANEPWEKQDKHILPSQEKGNNESGTRSWEKGTQAGQQQAENKKRPTERPDQAGENLEEEEIQRGEKDSKGKNPGTQK